MVCYPRVSCVVVVVVVVVVVFLCSSCPKCNDVEELSDDVVLADPARQHTKAEFQNIKGISKYFPLWHVDGHVSPSPKAAAAGRARRAGIEPGTRGL